MQGSLIVRARVRQGVNAVGALPAFMRVHFYIGTAFMLMLMGAGTYLFYRAFAFLMDQELFGPPLMDLLVGLVLLAFFSMLIFSNLIITLSTSYISREVDFLMGLPVPFETIFRQKLVESIFYSSWAFVLLSLPFFLAFGIARDVEWYLYPLLALILVPYLAIPALIGALVTLVVTAVLPARKTRLLSIVLAALSVLGSFAMARFFGFRQLIASSDQRDIIQGMSFLEFGTSPLLPSAWLVRGILALAPGDMGGPDLTAYVYWLAMLTATAAMLYQISEWLVPPLYYRGWALSRDSAQRDEAPDTRWSMTSVFDRLLWFLPWRYRVLAVKDLKVFWRDPSQWSQLAILFGLMVIYIVNLRAAHRYSDAVMLLVANWKTLLAFFNLGAICFILSIITTRFVYPMLSLEGRQIWSVGLAPMPNTTIVWQKWVFCVMAAQTLALSLLALSNWVLGVELWLHALSFGVTIVMGFALSSLSVGLGALMPDFKDDNPARIANGLGGTLNALISMAYIGVTVGMLALPAVMGGSDVWAPYTKAPALAIVYVVAFVGLQLSVLVMPMWLGLRRWGRIEF